MAKTISISDNDHKYLKHLSVDKSCSIMTIINDLVEEHKAIHKLKDDFDEIPTQKKAS